MSKNLSPEEEAPPWESHTEGTITQVRALLGIYSGLSWARSDRCTSCWLRTVWALALVDGPQDRVCEI